MEPERVTIPNTQVRYLQSSSNDQQYKLSIALPHAYAHSERTYPVLYVLDEPWLFAMYVQIVRALQIFKKELPGLIMVGIGYPTEAAGDLWALRTRDYTPTVDTDFVASFSENYDLPLTPLPNGSGGAEEFLSFLERDCLPWIEAEYGGETGRRLIVGWSFGGLFCLYTLFH